MSPVVNVGRSSCLVLQHHLALMAGLAQRFERGGQSIERDDVRHHGRHIHAIDAIIAIT